MAFYVDFVLPALISVMLSTLFHANCLSVNIINVDYFPITSTGFAVT